MRRTLPLIFSLSVESLTVEEPAVKILRSLPDVRQQQVLDFVTYLQLRDASQEENKSSTFLGDGLAAFRQWQIEFLNIDPDEIFADFQHPYHWAAFIPSGNWRSMSPSPIKLLQQGFYPLNQRPPSQALIL